MALNSSGCALRNVFGWPSLLHHNWWWHSLAEDLNGNFLLLATALDMQWKDLKVISKKARDRVLGRLSVHLLSTRAALHAQEETAGLATSLVRVLRK